MLKVKTVHGMGKDVKEVEVNAQGGKQTAIPYRFDLIDPLAMFALAQVTGEGAAKYEEDNWRRLSVESHINRVFAHLNAYLAGDTTDEHLEHALCRMMFAVAKHKRPDYLGKQAKRSPREMARAILDAKQKK